MRQEHLADDNTSVSRHLISLLASERDRVPPSNGAGWAVLKELVSQNDWDRPVSERLNLVASRNGHIAPSVRQNHPFMPVHLSRVAAVILLLFSVGILGYGVASAAGLVIPPPPLSGLPIPGLGLLSADQKVQGTVTGVNGNTIEVVTPKGMVPVSLPQGRPLPAVGSMVKTQGHKDGSAVRATGWSYQQQANGQAATASPSATVEAAATSPTPTPVAAPTPYPLVPITDATPGGLAEILGRSQPTATNTAQATAGPSPSPTRPPLSWGGGLPAIVAAPPPVGVSVPFVPLPANVGAPVTPPGSRTTVPAAAGAGQPGSVAGQPGTTAGAGQAGVVSAPSQPATTNRGPVVPAVPGTNGSPASGASSPGATAGTTGTTAVAGVNGTVPGNGAPTSTNGTTSGPTQPTAPAPVVSPVAPAVVPGQGGVPSGGGSDTSGGTSASTQAGHGTPAVGQPATLATPVAAPMSLGLAPRYGVSTGGSSTSSGLSIPGFPAPALVPAGPAPATLPGSAGGSSSGGSDSTGNPPAAVPPVVAPGHGVSPSGPGPISGPLPPASPGSPTLAPVPSAGGLVLTPGVIGVQVCRPPFSAGRLPLGNAMQATALPSC